MIYLSEFRRTNLIEYVSISIKHTGKKGLGKYTLCYFRSSNLIEYVSLTLKHTVEIQVCER